MSRTTGQGVVGTGNPSSYTITPIDFTATGSNTVIAGISNKTIRVFRIFFVVSAPTTITFKNGTTNLTGAMYIPASLVFDLSPEMWFYCTAGNAFIISQSGTSQVSGSIWSQQS